jgi:uncharacterized protein involved in exopolysaccharide biosynthesis
VKIYQEEEKMEENEVDLRDYLNVIIRRRKVALTVFFTVVITATIVSFCMPKVYQGVASIMVIPSKVQTALLPTRVSLDVEKEKITGKYLGSSPSMSILTHKMLLESNAVVESVIGKLKLTDKSGKNLTLDDLFKRLDIEEIKDTNLLQLKAEADDPEMAKDIANTWAQEYTRYSRELISGEVVGSGDFVAEQFKIVKRSLRQAEEAVKNFKNKYKIDLMKAELDIKKAKLNDYKKELIDLEIALKTKKDSLRELRKEIVGQERFIVVSKAITDDALWLLDNRKKSLADLDKRKLRSEVINPVYQNLENRIVDTGIEINTLEPRVEYLKKSLSQTQNDIDDLEAEMNERELEFLQLCRQVEIYKRPYGDLSVKVEDARIAKAIELGEVKIVSYAVEPKYPIKPRKKLNIAIAAVIGLMGGLFMAFVVEYFEKGKLHEGEKNP